MLYKVLLIVLVVVLFIYIRFAYKVPEKTMILQTSLNDYKSGLLLEKQPIVVQDRIKNIDPLWKSMFRYNIRSEFSINPEMEWIKNKYKYMMLHSLEDCEILLCNPSCKLTNGVPDVSEQVIAIKLYQHMSLIVPYRWYLSTNQTVHACGSHDLITYFLPS